ncbi:MAG: AFG1 family ATPase [Phenylobacterium sp.]|uniref:cell division protein ZapE n=1 Tax=Phenylobacterium sp. TaxID=1871053 RepID=UPI0025E01FD8|nr:cell division protein ZapE [Phenylobacterium sp.]MCA6224366.1 AFG1 family ATPase [Phenylobacterium sp.]MCA6226084.1 AFG1 family ATPase [Phenylobacterium sp.]MCA6232499.1 AFG1 family ATPase [Phenylobacterium sp.]MCA6233637.1 AFG1 family ATPase [Phenylobacterium sp.]MCA6249895.1 AFG1 family ATPase [Phenylobacterium sp.]
MPSALQTAYEDRVRDGRIRPDPAQAAGLAALVRLETDLSAARPGSLAGLLRRRAEAARGVYLWGPVGRGKSMLMDLFFETVPVARKRRTHFHVFMREVHELIGTWRSGDPAIRKARFGQMRGDDPVPPVADLVARSASLICFDEFQVTDIADAMILGRLFEALFARGVTLAATSNRRPDDLYRDGINRQLFLPFIELLKSRVDVVSVAGPHDYRLDRLRAAGTWFSPIDPDNRRTFGALWRDMLGTEAAEGESIEVMGRRLDFPDAAGGLVRVGFARLCDAALGPNDYLALAERFHTVFLEDLPRLTPDRREAARRFVTLIDALYEARTRLIVLAEAEPVRLYPAGDGAFEFERTASRLQEMRSADWLADRP